MSLRKWIYILLFGGFIIIGMPNAANSDETDTSSVKECRVHIEKALEEYWDKKEPSERTNTNYETLTDKDETDDSAMQELDEEDEEEEPLQTADTLTDKDSDFENKEEVENNTEEDDEEDDNDDNEDDDVDNEDYDDNDPDVNQESSENVAKSAESEEDEEENDEEEELPNEEFYVQTSSTRKISSLNDAESVDKSEGMDSNEIDENENDDEDENENDEDDAEEDNDDDNEAENEAEEENADARVENEVPDTEDTQDEELDDQEEDDTEDDAELTEENAVDNTKYEILGSSIQSNKIPKENTQVPIASEERKEPLDEPQPQKDVTISEETDSKSEEEMEESESKLPSPTDEKDDETIENIYEEDDDDDSPATATAFRSREHVDLILDLDGKGQEWDQEEHKLAQSIFKEIRKIETTSIRPMELLYKYADSTTRVLGDAELFNKPMLLFLGPWNSGKTSIINYILGIENTPAALKTGTGITDTDFTIITSGDRQRVVSGTELAADWRYAGTQKFGQGFLDHFRSIHIQNALLEKVIICDTPGILENRKNTERGYSLNDVFQWFIDRADAIYVVLDPAKVDIGAELGSVIEHLKGRDARFILNKADTIRRSDLMRVVGQLFWNLSPLMSSTEAPVIYAVSLTSKPYHPSAPTKFLADQEKNFFYDMKSTLEKHVENKILYARKHAVRVRNHAKMVDCFLATYYRHKSIFSSKRNIAKLITENPKEYNIFDGYGSVTNISRFDLPSPQTYKDFFKVHPLYDFKPLASTCSYFRGCPMDKLDQAIAKDIPELLAKYQKSKSEIDAVQKQER